MKVKVSVKTSPKVQEKYYEQVIAEAYAEMEAMFQENKDLRVSEGHLRDDLARAQALITELNDQITATEEDAEFWKKAAAENAELAEQNIAQVAAWERSANELKREVAYWKGKTEEVTAELVKCDVGHYQREIDEWKATADKLSEQLRELQAVFADLQLEHQELSEDYDTLVKTKCEYAEYIDTLRQENKRLRNQMSLPEFMRQFIEMTRETVQNDFPDSGNS